ncbi:fibrocystin [Platysternon megacephalum]|uniref:Fibrocystin n=1 Tax=Platysternon megacephalum TaxID=55544 RepID=A0A4D9EFT5_9SAUR|nr:fibrocystin [Platysternon megacephalum]
MEVIRPTYTNQLKDQTQPRPASCSQQLAAQDTQVRPPRSPGGLDKVQEPDQQERPCGWGMKMGWEEAAAWTSALQGGYRRERERSWAGQSPPPSPDTHTHRISTLQVEERLPPLAPIC